MCFIMCRIAAYQGKPCPLHDFLLAPEHSLHDQSWRPRELVSATVNADGWGVGWFAPDGKPALYRHTLPIWSDTNVPGLARSLTSGTWLGNVRSATPGLGTDMINTQPFAGDGLVYTHNGFIDDFARSLRRRLRATLSEAVEADVQGNTDSEYLFAMIRQEMLDQASGTLADALAAVVRRVQQWLADSPDIRALLAIVVSDGRQMAGVRAAANAEAPSLYFNPGWQDGAVIASEAFDDHDDWQRIEPDQVVAIGAGGHTEVYSL